MTRKEFLITAIQEMERYERAWDVYKKTAGCIKAQLKKRIKEYKKELQLIKKGGKDYEIKRMVKDSQK